jgi:solute carrier family 40 (iron-regulated transporter), member 1
MFIVSLVFTADGWGLTAACSVIVILGTLAHLASVGSSIVVYKDWIAIIAEGDSQTLARKSKLDVVRNRTVVSFF